MPHKTNTQIIEEALDTFRISCKAASNSGLIVIYYCPDDDPSMHVCAIHMTPKQAVELLGVALDEMNSSDPEPLHEVTMQ
jgi:hypothetical protein